MSNENDLDGFMSIKERLQLGWNIDGVVHRPKYWWSAMLYLDMIHKVQDEDEIMKQVSGSASY